MEEIMSGKKRDMRQKGEREIRWKKEIMHVVSYTIKFIS